MVKNVYFRLVKLASIGLQSTCAFNTVLIDLTTDNNGGQTSWDVVNVGTTTAVCTGSGYLNNQIVTLDCCLPDGCYELRFFDSAGDGMANGVVGGYILRQADGKRIIDNVLPLNCSGSGGLRRLRDGGRR